MASSRASRQPPPDVKVNVNYIGSFSDIAFRHLKPRPPISRQAQMFLTGTAQMVVGAIGKAEEAKALWFGTQSNQSSLAPSIVVSSQVITGKLLLKR